MENEIKFVCFDTYCLKCKNAKTSENEEPCNECLTYPTNTNSHKPVNFKEGIK